ncbi:unnamed protein product [Clonostachys chloroleuca]|uniref:NACHT domain-containing protein n=1 Tax=Clonostachys chloroleuca TaxID=1926264 RepID=A0AA35Q653_9HYPO|nr:unnamed protein product [Clonostachys chloroleuca]
MGETYYQDEWVGKTTLCKKAVHEFLYNQVWSKLFKRVLWVPLRNLQQRGSRYNLFELLSDEFFPHHPQREELASSVQRACQSPGGGQTLFILDGLDEIAHLLSGDTDMSRFVTELLNQPNVIVMSRPSASPPLEVKPFDLDVETLGFEPAQVEEFVHKVEPTNADAILSFLGGLPLIRDLVRIPIQLDALCFAWDEIYHCKNEPETMTDLYQAIERGLWKKDSHRLKRAPSGLTTDEHRAIGTMASVSKEVSFLEGLAFSGMYNNTLLFNANFRDIVAAQFYQPKETADGILKNISFMRTTDPKAIQRYRVYHFVHLTYQEYFAAKYFVRNWQEGTSLKCLRTHQTGSVRHGQLEVEDLTPVQFLQSHKYSARYDIFWRLVAGCLALEAPQPNGLVRFFTELDRQPLDFLGVAHQRLRMHCLREIPSTITSNEFIALKSQIEDEVCTWLVYKPKTLYGSGFGQYPLLTHERDCPSGIFSKLLAKYQAPSVLTRVLANSRFQIRQAAILALANQSKLPESTLHSLVHCLNLEGKDREIAARTIQSQPGLPSSILGALAAYLRSPDQETRRAAILSLGCQPWPDDILMTVMACLQSPDKAMQLAALDALARQSSLSEDKLLSIQGYLESQDEYIREAAFTVMGSQKELPESILCTIAAFVDNPDGPGHGAALEILGNHHNLPLGIIRNLAKSVQFQHIYTKRHAFKVLSNQRSLPEDVLSVLVAHLAPDSPVIQQATIDAIRSQPKLPPSIYNGILPLLESSDRWCRWAATSALGGKAILPKQARLRLWERLDDAEAIVRQRAILSLGTQSDLSNDDLLRIMENLGDGESTVRRAATIVLRNYPNLPNNILQCAKSLLRDEENYVRQAAVQVFGGQPNLSQDLLLSLVERISDKDRGVAASAIAALGGQATLSEETLRLLIERLQNVGSEEVRKGAIAILNNSPANATIKLSELSAFPLLMKHDAFRLAGSERIDLLEIFMSVMIQCSESHLAWYVHEGNSCIETQSGVQRLALEDERAFRQAIEGYQKEFRMPGTIVGEQSTGGANSGPTLFNRLMRTFIHW